MKNPIFFIIFPFLILSCNQKPVPVHNVSSKAQMDSFYIMAVQNFPNYDNISGLVKLIRSLDVNFLSDAMNDFENIDKYYGSDNLMAANIGVYMADMAYAWIYNEMDVAMNCNMAVLSLADRLEMANTFLDSFFQKYDNEDFEPDTILLLLERDLNEAIKKLPEEKSLEIFSATLTGNFVEKLHLIYEMIQKCPEISESPELILENMQKLAWIANGQMKALAELNKQIDAYNIPEEERLIHEELLNLNTMMHEAVFLNDTSIVRTVNLINDSSFIKLHLEINSARGHIINPV